MQHQNLVKIGLASLFKIKIHFRLMNLLNWKFRFWSKISLLAQIYNQIYGIGKKCAK